MVLPNQRFTSSIVKEIAAREIGVCRRKHTNSYNELLSYDLFDRNRLKTLYQRDIKGHTGCVNAIEFSSSEEFMVSGGDDYCVQIWSIANCCVNANPKPISTMTENHTSNIFAVQFSLDDQRIYSGGNDSRLIVHDFKTREQLMCFEAGSAIYRISNHPSNNDVIAAASQDGNAYVYDFRCIIDNLIKIKHKRGAYSVAFNPLSPHLLSVCAELEGLTIYDLRQTNEHYARAGPCSQRAICAEWNPTGDAIFCIKSNSTPIYFNVNNSEYVQLKDDDYMNACTVKSCAFAGSDYMVTGSDDWNIYVWKVPDDLKKSENDIENCVVKSEEAFTVLKGHRSIVNHVRYSEKNNLMFSCGVEKIIKCWSTYEMKGSYRDPPRRSTNTSNFQRYISHLDERYEESTEEDLTTLIQFDMYYQQARRVGNRTLSSSSGSTDSSPPFIDVDGNEFYFIDTDDDMSNADGFSDSDSNEFEVGVHIFN